MSGIQSILDDARLALWKILPGLTVLFVVLVLLRGFAGTVDAAKLQATTLVTSFLGAGEGLGAVLMHTLPLAIAAAVATFAIASRMLTFQSASSFVALACIILVGATVGGFLRGIVTQRSPNEDAELANAAETVGIGSVKPQGLLIDSNRKAVGIGVDGHNQLLPLRPQLRGSIINPSQIAAKPLPSKAERSPLDQLSTVDWLAEPDLEKTPPGKIEPLNVLPAVGGVLGAVFKAINQILGYLVAYQPRLFLAAIIAGSWIGWSWHRRLTQLHDRVVEQSDGEHDRIKLRHAA